MSRVESRRVCFVTSELYPLTAGGIGRLLHNLIREVQRKRLRLELHVMFPCWSEVDLTAARAAYGGLVTFHRAPSLDVRETTVDLAASYPPRWAFTDTPHHADSLELMLELKRLESEGTTFDVIEFPDYLGWGFASLQEKRLGGAFARTTLAVRLHATAGLIQWQEGQPLSQQQLGLFELERRALQDADLVVAHLAPVADAVQRLYGFDDAWRQAVQLEFPPVGELPPQVAEVVAPASRDIVFVTKVQPIKRPDLFVKGVAQFMLQTPAYKGTAVVACHVVNAEYAERVRSLVPPSLSKRFVFTGPGAGREALMGRSIVVIPSDFEALNLTAYEAAAAGGTLVLNAQCPAFSAGSPFEDGRNAFLFDGTIDGLAGALARATKTALPERVQPVATPAYFERPRAAAPARLVSAEGALVTVLVTNFNLARYLPQCIASIGSSTYRHVEVVIVDDASTDPLDAEILARIERSAGPHRVTVVRNLVNRGLSASRNIGLAAARGEFVMPLDADDCIHPRFIERATRALRTQPGFDVVVPTAGYFSTDEALMNREFIDYACFLGNAPSLGLLANRFSCATALIRADVLRRFPYDERLDSYEDWSVFLRMALAGHRFLVTNDIGFFYRRRPGSMIKGVGADRHERLMGRIYETVRFDSPGLQTRFLANLLAQSRRPQVIDPPPLKYQLADKANAMVKATPLHGALKKGLGLLAGDDARPLRHVLADKVVAVTRKRPRRA
jgi:glycosyltransferase involved in cell wall biosynthesis